MRPRGIPGAGRRVDMTPVDEIMALMGALDAGQRAHLEARIVGHPGLMRDCMGAWAFLHRSEMLEELPGGLRDHVDRFWRAIDRACRRIDRKPLRLPKCCRDAERRAKRALLLKRTGIGGSGRSGS